MKKGTTEGFMAVVAGVLLATMTSVYAFHAAQGKGNVSVAPKVSSQFQFVVARQLEGSDLKPGLNFVQFEMTRVGGPMSFQTFMTSTAIDFTIPDSPDDNVRTVKITGEMFSTTFPGVGPKRQPVAEFVPFKAEGMDIRTPDADPDFFSLTVEYRADRPQGPLFESLGVGRCEPIPRSDPPRIACTFEGPVEMGDGKVNVHTAGGD
jgi:hypothetical protein